MLTYFKPLYHAHLLAFLILTNVFFISSVNAQTGDNQAILQGAILVQPTSQPTQFQTDKVQPGHSVTIALLVENVGNSANPPAKVSIRFAFAKPLENEQNSILFETEQVDLTSIQPGSSIELTFGKTHQWPSLPDFIREDWGMREYQAILEIGERKELVGSLAITFSAYYYPGVRKELPIRISISK